MRHSHATPDAADSNMSASAPPSMKHQCPQNPLPRPDAAAVAPRRLIPGSAADRVRQSAWGNPASQVPSPCPPRPQGARLIIFDADDTLWDCQGHFRRAEDALCHILRPWASPRQVREELLATERRNVPVTGFGSKAFTLSLVETAVRVSRGRVCSPALAAIVELGRGLFSLPATPLPGVRAVLERLRGREGLRLAVLTKGDPQEQLGKVERSGLRPLFHTVDVVPSKTASCFRSLCARHGVPCGAAVMVGDSFRSDIAPALEAGCWAAHVPFHTTWALEHHEAKAHPMLRSMGEMAELLDWLS